MEKKRERCADQSEKVDPARMYPENQLGEQKRNLDDTFSAFTAVKQYLGMQ